jgi:hypothetical protein
MRSHPRVAVNSSSFGEKDPVRPRVHCGRSNANIFVTRSAGGQP